VRVAKSTKRFRLDNGSSGLCPRKKRPQNSLLSWCSARLHCCCPWTMNCSMLWSFELLKPAVCRLWMSTKKHLTNEPSLKMIAKVSIIMFTLILLAKRREMILNWLSSENFGARHLNIGETHCGPTGMWLIKDLELWFQGDGPRMIICKGQGRILSDQMLTSRRYWQILPDVRFPP
jgi:hypothetical protein